MADDKTPDGPTEEKVIIDITIAAPLAEVWQAVRAPGEIANWFGWDADTLEDEITFIFADHVAIDEAGHVLKFESFEGLTDRFELSEADTGTRLRVVRSGPAGRDWMGIYEDVSQGWMSFLQQLRLWLEQAGKADRRTLYVSGGATEGGALPIAATGLPARASAEPGAPARFFGPDGAAMSGMVWHRTDFQTGVMVPEWGNGMLIATDKPVSERYPRGGGSLMITTFGLDQAAFDALVAEWHDWFAARFPTDPVFEAPKAYTKQG